METKKRDLLFIASRILSYPSKEDMEEVNEVCEQMEPESLKKVVKQAIDSVYQLPLKELMETYVATFDLKAKFGLYLSAHEFGDSPKRGAALIKLQKIISEAGFERVDGELADYIPMLFEFIAITNDEVKNERLIKRLSCALQRILNELPKENPYYQFIALLMDEVFETPTTEDLEKMEQEREEADLEELPYPIMYQ